VARIRVRAREAHPRRGHASGVQGGLPGVWSPEDLLVAATASCYAVTLAAIAERSGVELTALDVGGLGHVERGVDGRFWFTVVELSVEVSANADPDLVERLAAKAEQACIVSLALDVPVHLRLAVADRGGLSHGAVKRRGAPAEGPASPA
jgi:organic hydroperoxide reductase OsmC/OhrA